MKVIITLATIVLISAQYKCPVKDGQYPDEKYCDKFWECIDGKPTELSCPDGLVYDPTKIRKVNKCDHPFSVDCGNRTLLQSPQPSENCPRRNGIFAHPDSSVCNIYYNCIDGKGIEVRCSDGLHFEEDTGLCKWPYLVGRKGCRRSNNIFDCPKVKQLDRYNILNVHPKYPHSSDCQKFYVCLNGVEPRELGCPLGQVYNEALQKCDDPTNVAGCEEWYDSSEEAEQKSVETETDEAPLQENEGESEEETKTRMKLDTFMSLDKTNAGPK